MRSREVANEYEVPVFNTTQVQRTLAKNSILQALLREDAAIRSGMKKK